MASFLQFGIKVPPSIFRKIEQFSHRVQAEVVTKATAAGAEIVKKEMQTRVPQSRETGTRKKWSKKTAARRSQINDLKNTITIVSRKYKSFGLSVVGPAWPEGNKVHPLVGGHKRVLWGRRTSGRVPAVDRWVKQSYDRTRWQCKAAMIKETEREVQRILNG